MQIRRQHIRKQLRRQQLHDLYKLNRLSLITTTPINIFKQLQQQIINNITQPLNMAITAQLIDILKTYPNQQNTYVVVGNYVIDHPQVIPYVLTYVITDVKVLVHYSWLLYAIVKSGVKHDCIKKNQGQEIVEVSANTVLELLRQLELTDTRSNKLIEAVWLYFLLVSINLTEKFLDCKTTGQTLHAFNSFMDKFQNHNLAFSEHTQFVMSQFCCKVLKNAIGNDSYQMQSFIITCSTTIIYCLQQLPLYRQDCIQAIKKVIISHPIIVPQTILTSRVIQQLIYLLDQTHQLKQVIVALFAQLLSQNISTVNLALYLQHALHISLIHALQWAIENHHENCIANCLRSVYSLLQQLQRKSQIKLMNRLLESINDTQFPNILETMLMNTQSQEIQMLLTGIVDSYYTEEVMIE